MRRVLDAHCFENLFRLFFGKLADNIGRIVGVHLVNQLGQLELWQRPEQLFPMSLVEFEQNLASDFARKEIEYEIRFLNFEPVDDVGNVGRIEVLENVQEEEFRTGSDDILNILDQFIVNFDELPILLG